MAAYDARISSHRHGVTYPPADRATEINPGLVFWDIMREGWMFNILIDGVQVKASAKFIRASEAKEAMRDEVKRLRDAL